MTQGMKDSLPIIALCIGFFLLGGFVFSPVFRSALLGKIKWLFMPRKAPAQQDRSIDSSGVPAWAQEPTMRREEPTPRPQPRQVKPVRRAPEAAPLYVSEKDSRNGDREDLEQTMSLEEAAALLKKSGYKVRKHRTTKKAK